MPELPFHPLISEWFQQRFVEPTPPQQQGWPEIAAGRSTLIAAPTGSGKTLAAFLVCIDRLFRQAIEGRLTDQIQAIYISPLKALSNDVKRNLTGPLDEIMAKAFEAGLVSTPIRALVRTGDTPTKDRTAMLKKPPHILVTTPESLYLLLTSAGSRKLLKQVDTVIVDEIHALARDKRGSHLALSLERLEALCETPPVRIGLSATQKPIEEIARFLVGTKRVSETGEPACRIVDVGHVRALDLDVEVPVTELSAVCSNEQWEEIDVKLAELINTHRSTLIFVNTRRMAERISYRLRERLGADSVASHHGSLSRDTRLDAEERLKTGKLKAIVATASLELGIDVGFIDLVCQIGSPRSIATFLQRVGRSGHHLGVIPKGRLFALTRDELMEALAIVRAVKQGRLDRVEIPEAPLDILAQQIVAEVSAEDWDENELYIRFKSAWPYRNFTRPVFDRIVEMVSEGIARGRKEGAYIHHDVIHHTLKARKSARLASITSGSPIPENADYRVVTEDDSTFVGTVNEDFAIESLPGDVFLLGNTSWRIRHVRGGQVVVRDAEGAPANVPFWLGEAPARTVELSEELSDLRERLSEQLDESSEAAVSFLKRETGANEMVAGQAVLNVAAQKAAVGFVPTQKRILFERFFDEAGGMQLVVHAPFGARINRAWGLAMRKRFCRTFDFELQASADDNGINLSLGPQHSFPLEQMFQLLKSEQAEDVLVQALLAAPMFGVRWRWNVTRALGVLRFRGGKKVPPPLQRFKADDLMSAVFPLQTACFEHRPPDVPLPDHPMIAQTVHDCLHEAMDVDGWVDVLKRIEKGEIELIAKDTREPSPFSHSILNANPYSFLDDAPLEERRARAVTLRRQLSVTEMTDLARLDPEAIARVQKEAAPLVRDADELHDTLITLGAWPARDGKKWEPWFKQLVAHGRATEAHRPQGPVLWVAAERWSLVQSAFSDAGPEPVLDLPIELLKPYEIADAILALVRGRIEISGPITSQQIADDLGLAVLSVESALAMLEAEGFVLQGRYSATGVKAPIEWCERRLLARIHRLTLDGARKRVQAVSPEAYWLFLAEHHHLFPGVHRDGPLGLREAVSQLQGFEMPAGAWETDVLSRRVEKYDSTWLDNLSFSGDLTWGRLRPPQSADDDKAFRGNLTRVVPVSLLFREDLPWLLSTPNAAEEQAVLERTKPETRLVYETLQRGGALFVNDLIHKTGLLPARVQEALGELAALGLASADGFSALRALTPVHRWQKARSHSRAGVAMALYGRGGRWTQFPGFVEHSSPDERIMKWASQLLRRYGVVFRDLLARETVAPPWWELVSVYRRMEARGEIRGGRFVQGVAGEQYAVPEAIEALRRPRDLENSWLLISAVDPLNLTGGILPGERVSALRGNRILLHNGRVVATLEAGEVHMRSDVEKSGTAKGEKITRALKLTQSPQQREELLKELTETK